MGILITATMSSGTTQASYLGMECHVSNNWGPISLASQSSIFSISVYSGESPGCAYKIGFSSSAPSSMSDTLCNYNLYVIWI